MPANQLLVTTCIALWASSAAARPLPETDTATTVSSAAEAPTPFARAELVSLQTLNGVLAGVAVCTLADCDESSRRWAGVLMLGGAVGFGGAFLLSGDGITPGATGMVSSGTIFGTLDGLLVALAFDLGDDKDYAAALLGGQVVGTLTGALLATRFHATGGQVALARSFGMWGGAAALLANGIANSDSPSAVGASTLAAMNLALLLGAYVADAHPHFSRGRSLMIDTGGGLGALVGAGVGVLIQGDDADGAGLYTATLIGVGVGLAVTTWATRHWDGPSLPAQISVVPTQGGAMGSLSLSW